MTYAVYTMEYIQRQEYGDPIFLRQIAEELNHTMGIAIEKAKKAAAVTVKRLMDNGKLPDLRRYQKGIYFRAATTPFGETGINKQKLIIAKYMHLNKGYETGLRIIYKMGLTTQIPAKQVIATNVVKDCVRYDEKLDVYIRPAKIKITAENKDYLQLLDILELFDKAPIDVEDPYLILAEYIRKKELCYETLLYYADHFYSKKTILQIAKIAGRRQTI